MSLRNRQPPGTDLLGRQVEKTNGAEHRSRLPEQPTELADRHPLTSVLVEVLVDELAQGQRRSAAARTDPIKHFPESTLRLRFAGESADLPPCRAAPLQSVAIRPQRPAVRTSRFELEHLTLLHHRSLLKFS
jgi:hypothetical protein